MSDVPTHTTNILFWHTFGGNPVHVRSISVSLPRRKRCFECPQTDHGLKLYFTFEIFTVESCLKHDIIHRACDDVINR